MKGESDMISYSVKAQLKDTAEFAFKGLSTDDKPTGTFINRIIGNGSTFFEMDSQEVYFYDGGTNSWLAQP
jgi:hypothetical protein